MHSSFPGDLELHVAYWTVVLQAQDMCYLSGCCSRCGYCPAPCTPIKVGHCLLCQALMNMQHL